MWAYRWLLVAGTLCVARGQIAEMSLDPLLSFVTCLRESKPGYCLQERALSYFEGWLATEEEAEENPSDGSADEEEEPGSKLSPYWKKMVDQVAERIAGFYQDDDDDTAGSSKAISGPIPPSASADQQIQLKQGSFEEASAARGHHKKKKKIKAIKKAIIKLVLIALLIKHKLKMLLTAFQTFLQFKAVVLATIYVLIHVAKLWIEIKHKHHPQKVIYYENAHHQHHYDHHDDHHHDWDEHGSSGGSGWSLWGRSGLEAPTTPFPPFIARSLATTSLPYAAHDPTLRSQPQLIRLRPT